MALRLTLENIASMPDGGPVSYSVSGKRGFDIGRDQYLDWVLPDPNRVVSGKHCEIRYKDGAYWLRDVSTNGTFVNRSERRLQEQHRLRSGDRVEIGHYIVNVEVEEDEGAGAGDHGQEEGGEPGMWGSGAGAAPPADPRGFRPARASQPLHSGDVLDWAASMPSPAASPAYDPPPAFSPAPSYAPAPPPSAYAAPPAPSPYAAPPSPAAPADDVWGGGGSSPPDAWDEPAPAPPRPAPPPEPAPVAFSPPPPAPPSAPPPLTAGPTPFDPLPAVARPAAPRSEPAPEPAMPRAAPFQPEPPPALEPVRPAPLPPLTPSIAHAPPAPPAPAAAPAAYSAAPSVGGAEFIRRFAKGARISDEAIAIRDAGALAELLGVLMNIAAANMGQLLTARAESKGAMRSANQTLIQATDNNPLRFSPTAEDALGIMFGRQTKSYLDAQRAFEHSFVALKAHQVDSFGAIQAAIQKLVADLDPKEIEKALDATKGGSLFANKKARLWDDFVTRWKMKAGAHETGLFGAFMQYFGEAYDRRKP